MIDFHSHVLPEIDDGAHSVGESIALLNMLGEQGVKCLAATPHFYAQSNSPEEFLRKRAAAYEKLLAVSPPSLPEIRLGAEVLYYPGISRMEQLEKFCLEGTRLLLLEMPVSAWSESTVREVIEIPRTRGVKVVLAHVERYPAMQKKAVRSRLLAGGIRWQVNANVFLSYRTRGKALKMLLQEEIRWIGSDCHDSKTRPPKMGEAMEFLLRKAGDAFMEDFHQRNLMDWKGKV